MSAIEPYDFMTSDDVLIKGIKNKPHGHITKRILCLHMMPATKESWIPFMEEAAKHGWLVHSIDFRGHGESVQQGPVKLYYRDFADEEHKKYAFDAVEALTVLRDGEKVDAIMGASVGANVALHLQVTDEIPQSVLVSPGLDFYGLTTLDRAPKLMSSQGSYVIATEDDERVANADDMAKQIHEALATPLKQLDIYSGKAHGTDILDGHKDRIEKIVDFIKSAK
jgi:pimeloyl-ACP methyl ester carboxylesterase